MNEQIKVQPMAELLGQSLCSVWQELCSAIEDKYDMEHIESDGGKEWDYEYKYRRGGKTLCALYARKNCIGFMIIFGKDERAKFEATRNNYSRYVQSIYDDAKTYHDGKWMMFKPVDNSLFWEFMQLLAIKRRPNRKLQ